MKTIINIKTNKDIKTNAQEIAGNLGLSLSAVLNAYLRHFIRNREVYFSLAPRMTPELEKMLGPIENDISRNRNLSVEISDANELKKHLPL